MIVSREREREIFKYLNLFLVNIKNDFIKLFKLLFDFNTRIDILVQAGPITGIHMEELKNDGTNEKEIYIFIATPDRLFQFYGKKNLKIEEIFEKYMNEKKLNYIEMPYSSLSSSSSSSSSYNKISTPNYGQFEIFKKRKGKLYSFCWLSFSGICHGLFSKENTIEKNNYEIIQFDNKIKNIISISISEYHIYLLYENKLEILMHPSNLISSSSSTSTTTTMSNNNNNLNSLNKETTIQQDIQSHISTWQDYFFVISKICFILYQKI